jgi:hypothetical protein
MNKISFSKIMNDKEVKIINDKAFITLKYMIFVMLGTIIIGCVCFYLANNFTLHYFSLIGIIIIWVGFSCLFVGFARYMYFMMKIGEIVKKKHEDYYFGPSKITFSIIVVTIPLINIALLFALVSDYINKQ